jgi:phage-related protein (TIGR01555 family)
MAHKNTVKGIQTGDSFQNFLAHVGRGTGNQNDGSHYGFHPISRIRQQLEWAYRGSWIAGRAVDCVAKDMTREGVTIHSDDPPDKLQEFDKEIARLQLWKQLCQTIQWSRLYGGAVAFMMIDGQDPETPLRIETIRKGQFKGLLPMDRWLLNPSLQNLVQEYGPHFAKPMFYDTVPDSGGMPRMKIHYTRLIRLAGVELPYWQRIAENLWGQSILERMWDRLIAFDSTTTGIAQLVYKAHLRTVKIKGLRNVIASNAPAMKGIVKNLEMIRSLQTSEGITLLDADDEFETHQYAFSGLDSVLIQFGTQLCGALEIPAVRLFGESPAGFNSGDSDLRNYYDTVHQGQASELGPDVHKLYRVTYISTFGTDTPKSWEIAWKPLWKPSALEKAQISQATTNAVNTAYESQIITRATALKELKQSSRETGVFTNISDEEITAAEADPDPSPEVLGLVAPEKPEPGQPGAAAKPAKDK